MPFSFTSWNFHFGNSKKLTVSLGLDRLQLKAYLSYVTRSKASSSLCSFIQRGIWLGHCKIIPIIYVNPLAQSWSTTEVTIMVSPCRWRFPSSHVDKAKLVRVPHTMIYGSQEGRPSIYESVCLPWRKIHEGPGNTRLAVDSLLTVCVNVCGWLWTEPLTVSQGEFTLSALLSYIFSIDLTYF